MAAVHLLTLKGEVLKDEEEKAKEDNEIKRRKMKEIKEVNTL